MEEELKLWKEKAEAYKASAERAYEVARKTSELNETLLQKQALMLTKLEEIRKELI